MVDLEPFCHERRILTDQSSGIIKVLSERLNNVRFNNSNTLKRLNESQKAKISTKSKTSSNQLGAAKSNVSKAKTKPLAAFMKKTVKKPKAEVKILYVYNDGLTSGVRKPVLMKDLKFN